MTFSCAPRRKNCARCSGVFHCGPQSGSSTCWCDALPHIMAMEDGGGCFCPDCLAAIMRVRGIAETETREPR